MPLFIDRLPFHCWTDTTRTPASSQWTIVLPVVLTEPTLLNPPPVVSATDWVLDTGNRGKPSRGDTTSSRQASIRINTGCPCL